MIILDEQLSNRRRIDAISAWYRGAVRSVTDLRPHTIIKDDAIPALLCKERQPTFVTLNVNHFWRKVPINRRFCVACFNVDDAFVSAVPSLLGLLFHHAGFRNKRQRVGHVFRIDLDSTVRFYRNDNRRIETFRL